MKTVFASLLWCAAVCFATALPAMAQQAPAKWGPGCDKTLLDGEFSLTNAPAMPCAENKKEYIDKVIKGKSNSAIVLAKSPHPFMDTPEFTAFYLRAFAEPTEPLDDYDFRFERLLSRVSQYTPMIEDPHLDWDMWRAWLLFENTANTSFFYKNRNGSMSGLDSARDLLWNYLSLNADAILKDPKRRAWWLTRLTADLEAEGGRPQRRWFLLLLLSAADPKREALEKIPMPEKFSAALDRSVPMRQPTPLDPFLIVSEKDDEATPFSSAVFSGTVTKVVFDDGFSVTLKNEDKPSLFSGSITKSAFDNAPLPSVRGINPAAQPTTEMNKMPSFSDALTKIAFANKLSLTVLGIDPATQPPTEVKTISLEMTKWPSDQSKVINQESWSLFGSSGYEWGVRFSRPVGRRADYSNAAFPPDRTDGVFFFVFNQRLYVWPKAKMDAAVFHMLRIANLIDDAAAADFEKRGFAPLKETLVKERP